MHEDSPHNFLFFFFLILPLYRSLDSDLNSCDLFGWCHCNPRLLVYGCLRSGINLVSYGVCVCVCGGMGGRWWKASSINAVCSLAGNDCHIYKNIKQKHEAMMAIGKYVCSGNAESALCFFDHQVYFSLLFPPLDKSWVLWEPTGNVFIILYIKNT